MLRTLHVLLHCRLTSAAFAETTPPADLKMSPAQCETLWKQALGSDTGDLAMTKAAPYAADFKKVDMNADGKLQAKEWMDGCNNGLIKSAAVQAPASPGGKTSDSTPEGATDRAPGARTRARLVPTRARRRAAHQTAHLQNIRHTYETYSTATTKNKKSRGNIHALFNF